MCVPCIVSKLIYESYFTCAKIYARQTLESLLHVQHVMIAIVSDVTHDVLKYVGDFLKPDVNTCWCM